MRRKTIRTLKEASSGARSFVLYHEKKMLRRVYESCCKCCWQWLVPADRGSVACVVECGIVLQKLTQSQIGAITESRCIIFKSCGLLKTFTTTYRCPEKPQSSGRWLAIPGRACLPRGPWLLIRESTVGLLSFDLLITKVVRS